MVGEAVSDLGNYCLNLRFLLHVPALLLGHVPPMQADRASTCATTLLMKPLADYSETTTEKRNMIL